jgi:Ca2+ transporting ATPase
MVIVKRNDKEVEIDSQELVVGDLYKLVDGSTIHADCVLINATPMACDESPLTGEPIEQQKAAATATNLSEDPCPFLLKSTTIKNGKGWAIVIAVGKLSRSGRADDALNEKKEFTPLQKKLDNVANLIGKIGMFTAALTFICMCGRLAFEVMQEDDPQWLTMDNGVDILNFFIFAITVIVCAVPEGLPLAVTLSLAYSVHQMFKQKNLVRKLHASETMGGAHEICSDKTGTLTQNKMTVQALYTGGETFKGDRHMELKQHANQRILREAMIHNSSAMMVPDDKGKMELRGNVTECGVFKYLQESGLEIKDTIKERDGAILALVPLTSSRKRQTTVFKYDAATVRVYVKGAPEMVLDLCKHHLDKDCKKQELTDKDRQDALNKVKEFACQAYRTLLVAYCDYTIEDWTEFSKGKDVERNEKHAEEVEANLVMAGIFGLVDPLRPGIKDAVKKCHNAGINVRMCTGDNIDTAMAISKEAGILDQIPTIDSENNYVCMKGEDFRTIVGGIVEVADPDNKGKMIKKVKNAKAFKDIAAQLKVLARSSPEDKYLLVTGLKELRKVVAVTGDGTNDAPALQKADVGFAMGITGTDVAKNASDIVLTDDNFCSLLTAVKFGRNIYDSVRKFLQFQVTVNVVALVLCFCASIIFKDAPFTAV